MSAKTKAKTIIAQSQYFLPNNRSKMLEILFYNVPGTVFEFHDAWKLDLRCGLFNVGTATDMKRLG